MTKIRPIFKLAPHEDIVRRGVTPPPPASPGIFGTCIKIILIAVITNLISDQNELWQKESKLYFNITNTFYIFSSTNLYPIRNTRKTGIFDEWREYYAFLYARLRKLVQSFYIIYLIKICTNNERSFLSVRFQNALFPQNMNSYLHNQLLYNL